MMQMEYHLKGIEEAQCTFAKSIQFKSNFGISRILSFGVLR
jgi:hypothetical protein